MRDNIVDIEGKKDLMHIASMHFESLDLMLETIEMDQSTYYSHLNDRSDYMSLDNVIELTRVVSLSEPRYRFTDPDEYIEVPEEDGWGEGRIKLEEDFRRYLFGRRLFDPLNEDLIEKISGFSRQDISNYRNEDRWIPEEGYRNLFNYFKRELNQTPEVSMDIYGRRGEVLFEDVGLNRFYRHFFDSDLPENKNKHQRYLMEARRTREKFDELLPNQEWDEDLANQELRKNIVDSSLNGERSLTYDNHQEKEKMEKLSEYGILEKLDEEHYWIMI